MNKTPHKEQLEEQSVYSGLQFKVKQPMVGECEANGHAESTVMDPSLSSHFIQPRTTSQAMMLHTFRVAL